MNLQLWTVPFELECYIAIAILAVFGVVRRHIWAPATVAALTVFDLFACYQASGFSFDGEFAGGVRGRELVTAFLCGVSIFLYKDRIPYNAKWGIGSAILGYALLITPNYGDPLAIIPLAYLTAWLGLMNPAKIYILKGADYSYGIYLYGFAIQQAVQHLIPQLNWAGNFIIALTVVSVISAVSWIFIEKPALKARPALMAFEAKALDYIARTRNGFYGFLIARNTPA